MSKRTTRGAAEKVKTSPVGESKQVKQKGASVSRELVASTETRRQTRASSATAGAAKATLETTSKRVAPKQGAAKVQKAPPKSKSPKTSAKKPASRKRKNVAKPSESEEASSEDEEHDKSGATDSAAVKRSDENGNRAKSDSKASTSPKPSATKRQKVASPVQKAGPSRKTRCSARNSKKDAQGETDDVAESDSGEAAVDVPAKTSVTPKKDEQDTAAEAKPTARTRRSTAVVRGTKTKSQDSDRKPSPSSSPAKSNSANENGPETAKKRRRTTIQKTKPEVNEQPTAENIATQEVKSNAETEAEANGNGEEPQSQCDVQPMQTDVESNANANVNTETTATSNDEDAELMPIVDEQITAARTFKKTLTMQNLMDFVHKCLAQPLTEELRERIRNAASKWLETHPEATSA